MSYIAGTASAKARGREAYMLGGWTVFCEWEGENREVQRESRWGKIIKSLKEVLKHFGQGDGME